MIRSRHSGFLDKMLVYLSVEEHDANIEPMDARRIMTTFYNV